MAGRVLVIGGGIAGFAAALGAVAEGAEVTVVARAPGATALYAGGMEIISGLDQIPTRDRHHPLARLGLDPVRLTAEMDDAVQAVVAALARGGLRMTGDWRRPRSYADIHGMPRPAALVPDTVAAGELGALHGRRVAVVDVAGIGEYDAAEAASALREISGLDAFTVPVSMPPLPPGGALTDIYGLPAPAVTERADAIAFPPGLTGLPPRGFELLASPPAPHGWRLQHALSRALAAAGVRFEAATVTSLRVADGRALAAVGVGIEWEADSFVLATGRFIGGGLVGGRTVREPLLELGVFFNDRPLAASAARLKHLEYLSPAPAFRTGLRTDSDLRPQAPDGLPPLENLRAAGSVLGGYDYGAGAGFGVPILTGWIAGRLAARPERAAAIRGVAR